MRKNCPTRVSALGQWDSGGAERRAEARRAPRASHLESDDLLLLLAEPRDAEAHHVSGFEELRRLHAEADAGRGAGDDHVARLHDEELRAVPDEMGHAED